MRGLASTALVAEIAARWDSRANGIAETTVKEVSGLLRTIKLDVEKASHVSLQPGHAVMTWMVEHVATILSRHKIGIDGETAFERIHRRRANRPLCNFGEKILVRETVRKDRPLHKLEPRFDYGVYMGQYRRSGESFIGVGSNIHKVVTIKRLYADERWCGRMLMEVQTSPGEALGASAPISVEVPAAEEPRPVAPREEVQEVSPRRLYINKADILVHGPTKNCPGCRATLHGAGGRAHWESCRHRLERNIAAENALRVEMAERRMAARSSAADVKVKVASRDEGPVGAGLD